MTLRINTNTAATNGHRNLLKNDAMVSKSLERLSSGLRINRAADDAAGLIISEQMRAQITGLNQAIANSEQAVTMIQTAEGALDEVSTLLNKARSLAIHAANEGLNDSNQLIADQTELDNIIDSVNRIADSTQFGTKKILDGTLSNGSSNSSAVSAVKLGGDYTSLISASSAVRGYHTLVMSQAATQSSYDLAQANGADIWSGGSLQNAANTDQVQTGFKMSINGASLDIASGTTKSQLIQQLNAIGQQVGFSASLITGTAVGSGDIRLIARDFGSSFSFDVQYVNGATGAANLGGPPVDGADAVGFLYVYTGANGNGGTATTGSTTVIRLTGGTGLTLRSSGGTIVVLSSAVGSGVVYGAVDGTSAGATFQVGANANQTASVELASVQASQLGNGGSGIYSSLQQLKGTALLVGNATDALKVIDKAISDVTVTRGNLGAFQANTLETAISSLRNTQENLLHAESTIRDVDFAAESAKFTKYNILVQSSTSMLAQANQLPQNVLKLLG